MAWIVSIVHFSYHKGLKMCFPCKCWHPSACYIVCITIVFSGIKFHLVLPVTISGTDIRIPFLTTTNRRPPKIKKTSPTVAELLNHSPNLANQNGVEGTSPTPGPMDNGNGDSSQSVKNTSKYVSVSVYVSVCICICVYDTPNKCPCF